MYILIMSRRPDYSKKILKFLSEKTAISLPELAKKALVEHSGKPTDAKAKAGTYALTRSLKGLEDCGLIEQLPSGQTQYARLTRAGRVKASSQKLDASGSILDPNWDGKWRIILLDLPESRKNERESLRYLLKKAGFVMLKNSAWISPYPFEHLFTNIKKDLGLTSELMIITTNTLDEVTKEYFFENFKK
jgi:hypothetical protein